jgi:UPF0716 family protein affecting phage T7 exclusion
MRTVVIFFFIELFVSIKVGIEIGFIWSAIWIIASMFLGLFLLRLVSYSFFNSSRNFTIALFDIRELYNSSFAYIFGAILLIIPGVVTDFMGVFLLLYVLYLHLFVTISHKNIDIESPKFGKNKGDIDVIDAEIIDECNSSNKFNKSRFDGGRYK